MDSVRLRSAGLTWHVIGDDIVVLDLQRSVYLRLSGSGRFVWELLDEPRSERELATAVQQTYGIDSERATDDIAQFIGQLRDLDLLVGVHGAGR